MVLHTLSLVVLTSLLPPNPNPWQEVNKREDVTVWARAVPNSSVREVRAEGIIEAPITNVWSVLGDIEHFVDFMPYVVETRVLETKGNGHFEYTLLNPPLVSKRDYTLEITTVEDPNGEAFVRSWTSANHKGPPPRDGAVRLDVVEGSWTLEKIDGTHTRATYMLLTDPGGNIPSWMANKANTTSLPDLMNAVRQRALDPNYHR
jgi:uncharacterized protein YndB with AHSA1/START domain